MLTTPCPKLRCVASNEGYKLDLGRFSSFSNDVAQSSIIYGYRSPKLPLAAQALQANNLLHDAWWEGR